MFVKYKIKGLNDYLIFYISIIQDSIIICQNPVSSAFIGELVFLKENNFKGIVFEVNLKSILFLGVLFNILWNLKKNNHLKYWVKVKKSIKILFI